MNHQVRQSLIDRLVRDAAFELAHYKAFVDELVKSGDSKSPAEARELLAMLEEKFAAYSSILRQQDCEHEQPLPIVR